MSSRIAPRTRRPGTQGGFTLIEAAMATVIIGVGVLAMIDAQSAFIRANLWSNHAASATFLANEIREYTRLLPRHDPVSGLVIDGGVLYGWGPDEGEITVDDFDDLDDFDGITFSGFGSPDWADGDLPGPIDAFGTVIPEITLDGVELGASMDDGSGQIVFAGEAMNGWSQTVEVDKIDPFDTAIVYAPEYFEGPVGVDPGRPVDSFPLRVTVRVFYQSAADPLPSEVIAVTWIVP
ncbi:MAG: hypothetical protein ACF8Q5_03880 [Phycisphaerales bacterium JB040]